MPPRARAGPRDRGRGSGRSLSGSPADSGDLASPARPPSAVRGLGLWFLSPALTSSRALLWGCAGRARGRAGPGFAWVPRWGHLCLRPSGARPNAVPESLLGDRSHECACGRGEVSLVPLRLGEGPRPLSFCLGHLGSTSCLWGLWFSWPWGRAWGQVAVTLFREVGMVTVLFPVAPGCHRFDPRRPFCAIG